ncbi:transforming growth factor beta regulator 1 isoform X1 [Hydra vulgaris]|uniref:transforming growth factor beta regulator 1 isoform X1 n=1 Tax=Hydra vulgaris TaxID=6087 RepID=UPI0006412EAA|nr:transforming growth factor beta regulator 1 [Hydra vulgaris]
MEGGKKWKKEEKKKTLEKSHKDYEKKYKYLKKVAKQQVFINAALYDEVANLERHFVRIKAERKWLMKRLFKHLPMSESQVIQSTKALDALERANPGKVPLSILSPVQPEQEKAIVTKKKVKLQSPLVDTNRISPTKTSYKTPQTQFEEDIRLSDEKPKRKKPGTARKRVLPLHLDDLGVPLFPITLGTLCVYDLGEVVSHKPGFHSERYIWPVGFCSTRLYPSMKDPDYRVQYFCYIKDGGSDPMFEIIPEDEPDQPITAMTATACHCVVLKRLNTARGKTATNTGSGPEFFGFSHPTIQYLIENLPGANYCEKYQRQNFELAENTTAASGNVIRIDNLPNLLCYNRFQLKLPQI